jgi:hypothetical protein
MRHPRKNCQGKIVAAMDFVAVNTGSEACGKPAPGISQGFVRQAQTRLHVRSDGSPKAGVMRQIQPNQVLLQSLENRAKDEGI